MSIVFTGGTGMLGNEMRKLYPNEEFPLRHDFDCSNPHSIIQWFASTPGVDTVVHMAATTDCVGIESNDKTTRDAIMANIGGTAIISAYCLKQNLRLIYISTDYVFSGSGGNYRENSPTDPINKYGMSKLGGECSVRMLDNSVVVRTSICPSEFKYDKAFNDQYTSRLKVEEFAVKLKKVIDSDFKGVIHIGDKEKSVLELAKELSPEKEIEGVSRRSIANYPIPFNTSLNTVQFNTLFG